MKNIAAHLSVITFGALSTTLLVSVPAGESIRLNIEKETLALQKTGRSPAP